MSPAVPDLPMTEAAIIELTNTFRRENHLGEVKPSPALTKAAHAYAEFLAQSEIFSHTADGRQPSDRIKAAGYEACLSAENLSWNLNDAGYETRVLAVKAVEGWKNSPGHRKNMLEEHATETGVAVVKATHEQKFYSVQLFARPKSLGYEFRIANASPLAVRYTFAGESIDLPSRTVMTHTTCKPGSLDFSRAGGQALTGHYETRSGDTFTIDRGSDGKAHVSYQPGKVK